MLPRQQHKACPSQPIRTAVGDENVGGRDESRDRSGTAAVVANRAHLMVKLQEASLDGALQLLQINGGRFLRAAITAKARAKHAAAGAMGQPRS